MASRECRNPRVGLHQLRDDRGADRRVLRPDGSPYFRHTGRVGRVLDVDVDGDDIGERLLDEFVAVAAFARFGHQRLQPLVERGRLGRLLRRLEERKGE